MIFKSIFHVSNRSRHSLPYMVAQGDRLYTFRVGTFSLQRWQSWLVFTQTNWTWYSFPGVLMIIKITWLRLWWLTLVVICLWIMNIAQTLILTMNMHILSVLAFFPQQWQRWLVDYESDYGFDRWHDHGGSATYWPGVHFSCWHHSLQRESRSCLKAGFEETHHNLQALKEIDLQSIIGLILTASIRWMRQTGWHQAVFWHSRLLAGRGIL